MVSTSVVSGERYEVSGVMKLLSVFVFDDVAEGIGSLVVEVDITRGDSLDAASLHDVGHIDTCGGLQHIEGLLDGYGHVAAEGTDTTAVGAVDVDVLDS